MLSGHDGTCCCQATVETKPSLYISLFKDHSTNHLALNQILFALSIKKYGQPGTSPNPANPSNPGCLAPLRRWGPCYWLVLRHPEDYVLATLSPFLVHPKLFSGLQAGVRVIVGQTGFPRLARRMEILLKRCFFSPPLNFPVSDFCGFALKIGGGLGWPKPHRRLLEPGMPFFRSAARSLSNL